MPETVAPSPGAVSETVGGGGVRRAGHRRVHVGLDLGRGEGPVVDADVVDLALEVLAPDRVAADVQGAGGGDDRAGHVRLLTWPR